MSRDKNIKIKNIVLASDHAGFKLKEEIKNISEYYGANVPFIRPSEYSQDKSPDILWVKHALDFFREIKNYEFFNQTWK